MTQAPDPALLEALAKRNERPHLKQEEDKNEGQKVFHPGAAKAMKLRQATLCDPIEPPQVDPAKIDEAVTLTTEVLGEMQTGALSVADREALGAKVPQTVGHGTLQRVLEEELPGWPGGQHPARSNHHRKGQGAELGTTSPWTEDGGCPPPDPRTTVLLVRPRTVFAPEYEMDDAMAIDHEAVITEYKEMKTFLQTSNTRQFAPKLYSELPETSEGAGARRGDGWTSPPCFQACAPHTDVQSPFWRTSPVWWSVEVGLWTFQPTQVGQAAETGGAHSPRNPYSPS